MYVHWIQNSSLSYSLIPTDTGFTYLQRTEDPGELLGEFLPNFFPMHSMYKYLAAMACRRR